MEENLILPNVKEEDLEAHDEDDFAGPTLEQLVVTVQLEDNIAEPCRLLTVERLLQNLRLLVGLFE